MSTEGGPQSPFRTASGAWPPWREILAASVDTGIDLAKYLPVDAAAVDQVARRYPMRVNPYYLRLIGPPDDGLFAQAVPQLAELADQEGFVDPLAEEAHSPVPNLVHRYEDRVLWLVSTECAMICRFCTRKRRVGRNSPIADETLALGLAYIRDHRQVRDVLVSGGDPLLLEDERLAWILASLRAIPHVEILRLGTRVPCTLPHRITPELIRLLAKYHPVYLVTHFNHPAEITAEAAAACGSLADAGIPLACQTVLLRGVNDDPEVMVELMRRLVSIRVRPYYLHQLDLTRGASHFRTPIAAGLEIVAALRRRTSGLCVPHYVVDLPGGGGKVQLAPETIVAEEDGLLLIRTHRGEVIRYPLGCKTR
jgi:lysine 2,3-aminomutase